MCAVMRAGLRRVLRERIPVCRRAVPSQTGESIGLNKYNGMARIDPGAAVQPSTAVS